MALLDPNKKKNDMVPAGVTMGPKIGSQEARDASHLQQPEVRQDPQSQPSAPFRPVQDGIKLSTAMPRDPLHGIAEQGDHGIHVGAYQDSAGTAYFVLSVADGHVAFCRIDGGHPTQLRVIPAADFAAKRNGVQVYRAITAGPR